MLHDRTFRISSWYITKFENTPSEVVWAIRFFIIFLLLMALRRICWYITYWACEKLTVVLTEVTTPNVRNYRGQLPFNNSNFSSSEKKVNSGKEFFIIFFFFAFHALNLILFSHLTREVSLPRALKRTPLKRWLNCNKYVKPKHRVEWLCACVKCWPHRVGVSVCLLAFLLFFT